MPTFRAAATGSGDTSAPAVVPASVQPGDALVLIGAASITATLTAPAGWTPLGPQQQPTDNAIVARAWRKVATAADAGAQIAVTNDGDVGVKSSLLLLAYTGTDQSDPVHLAASAVHGRGQSSHIAPTLTTTIPGCEIVQVCVGKSSHASTWVATPTGFNIRAEIIGTGGGHINGCAVSTGPAQPGTWGGGTFTQDTDVNSAITFTIALAPTADLQTLRPVIDVNAGSYTAVPTAGEGVALATRIGESIRNDDDFLLTSPGPMDAVYETQLSAGWDPGLSTDHTWTVVLSTVGGASTSTCRVELLQAGSVIAVQTITGVPATPTTYSYTLSNAEADAISDYADLRLRFTWTAN